MNFKSIRFRVAAWYAGLLAALLLLFGGFVYFTLEQFLERNLHESLTKEAQTISEALLSKIDQTGDAYVVNEIEEHFAPRTTSHFLRVTRAGSGILYQSGQPQDATFDPVKVAAAKDGTSWNEQEMPNGRKLFVYTMMYVAPGGPRFSIQAG